MEGREALRGRRSVAIRSWLPWCFFTPCCLTQDPAPGVTEQSRSRHPGQSCPRASLLGAPVRLGPTPEAKWPFHGHSREGCRSPLGLGASFPGPLSSCSFRPPCGQGTRKDPQDPEAEAPAGRVPREPSLELTGVGVPASPALLGAHKRFFHHLGLENKTHWGGRVERRAAKEHQLWVTCEQSPTCGGAPGPALWPITAGATPARQATPCPRCSLPGATLGAPPDLTAQGALVRAEGQLGVQAAPARLLPRGRGHSLMERPPPEPSGSGLQIQGSWVPEPQCWQRQGPGRGRLGWAGAQGEQAASGARQ